jgi:hypothetical protein
MLRTASEIAAEAYARQEEKIAYREDTGRGVAPRAGERR